MRKLLTLFDVQTDDVQQIFELSHQLKQKLRGNQREPMFPGRVLGLLFEKPSLRTRVSFEAAITHLGGNCLYLGKDVGWGERETTADFGRVLSQYLDVLVCRTRDHAMLDDLASYCQCAVINGLTNRAHPCQALADLFTLRELIPDLEGQKLAFIGDGNNVARSLAVACAHVGVSFAAASPKGYWLEPEFLDQVRTRFPNASLSVSDDPIEAVTDAVAVYTDVWASMGQETERQKRKQDFAAYQVNSQLLARAPKSARFLHCLPAHRGDEVTDEVIDGPQSVVVHQAANRMHVQKGILAWLLSS